MPANEGVEEQLMSLRSTLGAALAASAVVAGLAVSPAQAANDDMRDQAGIGAPGSRTYNPNAPLGSANNPLIIGGQDQALLSSKQVKGLLESKRNRSAQAANGNTAQLASGCIIGAYWSSCNSVPNFGTINLATSLGSDHHEYATQQGWLYDSSQTYKTYMDRSSNGGASWQGQLGLVLNNRGWGESIYDGPPYVSRGCLYSYTTSLVWCTGWH
ncbi:hypothetical protein ACWGK1_40920 [Streptomyces wedmorensis]